MKILKGITTGIPRGIPESILEKYLWEPLKIFLTESLDKSMENNTYFCSKDSGELLVEMFRDIPVGILWEILEAVP